MKLFKNAKRPVSSVVLYIAALVVACFGAALLANNIILFRNTIASYVAQGYPAADVTRQLLTSQLLPGIFEPIAVYGGIAIVLFGAGMINQKVSKCLTLLTESESGCEAAEGADRKNIETASRAVAIDEAGGDTDGSK